MRFKIGITLIAISISGMLISPAYAEISERTKAMYIVQSQETVKSRLKDPSSAKFRNLSFHVWQERGIVCGEVNSKNAFGGYGGYQKFVASPNLAFLEEEVSDFYNTWNMMCR